MMHQELLRLLRVMLRHHWQPSSTTNVRSQCWVMLHSLPTQAKVLTFLTESNMRYTKSSACLLGACLVSSLELLTFAL